MFFASKTLFIDESALTNSNSALSRKTGRICLGLLLNFYRRKSQFLIVIFVILRNSVKNKHFLITSDDFITSMAVTASDFMINERS